MAEYSQIAQTAMAMAAPDHGTFPAPEQLFGDTRAEANSEKSKFPAAASETSVTASTERSVIRLHDHRLCTAGSEEAPKPGWFRTTQFWPEQTSGSSDCFVIFVGIVQVLLILLFILFTTYDEDAALADNFNQTFMYYLGVSIMMLIGFGYLMTFLRYGGLSAVGFTLLITMLAVQTDILAEGFFKALYDDEWSTLELSINDLILGNFAAAACLISFGGLIGKVGMQCLAPFMLLETICYAFSCQVIARGVGLADMGGTVKIHLFGAYFGLAASAALGRPVEHQTSEHAQSSRSSDVKSLIGTIFLWIFWPTFNGAGAPMNSQMQQRVVLNTIFALTTSCVSTFVLTRVFFKKKFGPVDVQNGTLAGGVMVGATCNYMLYPGGAAAIGFIAGGIAVTGYNVVMLKFGQWIHDSCGIHNLHGMPSIAGAIVSVILAATAKESDYTAADYKVAFPHGDHQWWRQLLGTAAILAFAIVSGFLTMTFCKLFMQGTVDNFRDKEYWATDYRVVSGSGDEKKDVDNIVSHVDF